MTATKQFIDDAIKGGWKSEMNTSILVTYGNSFSDDVCRMLLDPLAWQGVGKTRGWKVRDDERLEMYTLSGGRGQLPLSIYEWCKKWHRFIDNLADGKTIEEALSANK